MMNQFLIITHHLITYFQLLYKYHDLQITEHDTPAKVSNISTDPEYAEPVQTNPCGRKRNKINQKKRKKYSKGYRPYTYMHTAI